MKPPPGGRDRVGEQNFLEMNFPEDEEEDEEYRPSEIELEVI